MHRWLTLVLVALWGGLPLADDSAARAQGARPGTSTSAARSDPPAERAHREGRRARLRAIKSWGYQLRLIEPDAIAASPFDLVVTDHALAANRRFVREFSPAEIERMKTRPDGSRRLLLAYLSIGEAERYRFYWRQEWYEPGKAPSWLASANDRWEGNWRARFWDPGWQQHIFSGADNYLARVKAQGFDGVYLDRADVYQELVSERPEAEADMIRFIGDLAIAARRDNPSFLIVMQNAEELIRDKTLQRILDGVAKEDLLFGVEHDERPNPPDMVEDSLAHLRRAQSAGIAVLTVEYLSDPQIAAEAQHRARQSGFVHLNAERSLGELARPAVTTGTVPAPVVGR